MKYLHAPFRGDAAFEIGGVDPVACADVGLVPVPIHSKDQISRIFFQPFLDISIELLHPDKRGPGRFCRG